MCDDGSWEGWTIWIGKEKHMRKTGTCRVIGGGGDKKYKNTKIQIKKEWIEGRKWGVYVREKGVNGQEDKAPTVGSIEVENNGTSTG